jgi:hypothetical protein
MNRVRVAVLTLSMITAALAPRVAAALDSSDAPFVRDGLSIEGRVGPYWSPVGIGPDDPSFDFVRMAARLGWMLNDASAWSGPLRGSFQMIFEVEGGPVFDGFGDWLVGPAVWIRYNFVQPGWRVVPYLQGGLGLIFSDAYQDKSQDAIGTNPELTVQAAVGARFLLDEHWSLDLEGGYEHISNADIAKRNDGVNALGASAGFTCFFDVH